MSTLDLRAATAGWPVGRAAVAVIARDGATLAVHDPGGTFAWASVTKLLTALCVLDACADGTVHLTDPASPPGSTVAHLLAHASGLPFEGSSPIARPGSKRTYSNTGYAFLGDHLAAAAGVPFADVLDERVLQPLGLTDTVLSGPPASGAVGSLGDLIRLAAELIRPRILGPQIVDKLSTVAFPGLVGVLPGFGRQTPNDWGLGAEIRGTKSPHWTSPENSPATFGHFGQSGSFLWVDPTAGLGCVSLADEPFGPWAVTAWPVLSTQVLAAFRT